MQLETERLQLREFCLEDANDLWKVLGDEEVMRFVEPPFDLERSRLFIIQQGLCDPPRVHALVQKSTNVLIGYVIFHPLDHAQVYEIGWILGRAYWRQGYAYEIGAALIAHGFSSMGLHKIVGETIDGAGTGALMCKLGMRQEGVLRQQSHHLQAWHDVFWYGILTEDW